MHGAPLSRPFALAFLLSSVALGCGRAGGPWYEPDSGPVLSEGDAGADDRDATTDASSLDGSSSTEDAGSDAGIEVPRVPTNDSPTPRTSALFALLSRQVEGRGAFFGQQYASWVGNGIAYDGFDSDVSRALTSAIGEDADHPAVFGWNFETWSNGNASLRDAYRRRLIDTDARGGINTIHWPMGNFLIECAAPPCGDNDNDPNVDPIALIASNAYVEVPFTTDHAFAAELFDAKVDTLAAFLETLRDANGDPIPIVFRPFHEMNNPSPGARAHWWTGRNPAQYRAVWQRMVDRLRVVHGLDQLLFAFAPSGAHLLDGSDTPAALYLRYWPETDASAAATRYVDIAAFDTYLEDSDDASELFEAIRVTYAFANASERMIPRISAIAECGRKNGTGAPTDGGPVDYQDGPFWTERVLPGLEADEGLLWTRFAYLMTWTNGTFSTYPEAPRAQSDDFVAWFGAPGTLFLRDVEAF